MTTEPIYWTITAIGSTAPHASDHAPDHTAAWTAALRAGRTALLNGQLDTLSVTIGDNHCGALLNPARDQHDQINPNQLTTTLLDLHQAATASELADQLTAAP